jgi:DNA-binding MarR family transcriptional regulator/N-acetylglutamate synthase-like GNAT family acetyltransferase
MAEPGLDQRIAAVRQFNRFYTQRIGVLRNPFLESPFSLTEARVLFELGHRDQPAASEISRTLGLDPGYLSRILRGFSKSGLIAKQRSDQDGRQSLLSLTASGRKAVSLLDSRSDADVSAMLLRLDEAGQRRLVDAMQTAEMLLGERPEPKVPYLLRPPVPGDLGWVVARHGVRYGRDYGWNDRIEGLTAEIIAAFVANYDATRERCWIAEREGENVGCVLLVKKSERVAQLRLLLVEPQARGLGIGARLVAECERFARQAGYGKIMLWTHSILGAARHIYEQGGYRMVATDTHDTFGPMLTGETWELSLTGGDADGPVRAGRAPTPAASSARTSRAVRRAPSKAMPRRRARPGS